jgi:Skp family chaperone for outer membrane proteins
MRQIVRSALLGLACVASAAAAAGAQAKVGYVNTQAALAQSPARSAAETEFNRRMAPLNAEMQKMDSTWKSMLATFSRDSAAPTTRRESRAQEMQQRQQQYQARMQQIDDSATALRARLMQPIMQQLEKALEEVRREGGYAMIFDVAQGSPIVAADTTLDVTARLIAKLKAGPAAASGTPARPAPGPVAAPAGVTSRPPAPRR